MPYAPGITYRGDQNLAAGIASLGESLGRMAEQRKQDGRKATLLRNLWAAYKPDEKDVAATKSLPELEGMVQGAAVQQRLQEQQGLERLRQAQITNLNADNARSDENLALLREQNVRTKRRDEGLAGFARDFAAGPEVSGILRQPDVAEAFPGIAEQATSPLERLRFAMQRNPDGVTGDLVQTLVRAAAEAADPNRKAMADAKLINAEATLKNAERPRGGKELTPYQEQTLELRKLAMDDRRRISERAAVMKQLDGLIFEPKGPEVDAKRAQLQERLEALSGEPKGTSTDAVATKGGSPAFGFDDFTTWKGSRK